jgi:phage-related protein
MLNLRKARLTPVEFIGGSKRDLSGFPDPVKRNIGHALFVAQQGGRAPNTMKRQGFGGGSLVDIVEDHDGGGYRCVYTTTSDINTTRLKRAIYVLHAFEWKSKRGRRTPQHEIDLVQARLNEAEDRDRHAERSEE